MPTSVRLDTQTEALIRRLTREQHRSKSEVIRDALRILARAESEQKTGRTHYETVKHLIGISDSGGQYLSQQTGKRFTEQLLRKRHERRPG